MKLGERTSIQVDAWTNTSENSARNTMPGLSLHATFHPTATDQVGMLGSIGAQYSVQGGSLTRVYMTNFGLEWAHNTDKWRIYTQAGYTSNINGMVYIGGWDTPSNHIELSNVYAALGGTYYYSDALALSFKVGADKYTSPGINWVKNTYEVNWGAKVEFQPELLPVIGYLTYKGRYESFDNKGDGVVPDDGFSGHGVETTVLAGVKIPLGRQTIRSLNEEVGLVDMNPAFGDFTY